MEASVSATKRSMDPSVLPPISDDEDSFVVLETENSIESLPSEILPPFRTNKVHEIQKLLEKKISEISVEEQLEPIAKLAISPDASHEEVQKQVEDLIKENETLKNIIAQNNISMKSQYGRFVEYKDDVTNIVKSYKEKFVEAKTCIEKFKEENAKLVSEIEVYINIKKLHEEEIVGLKEKLSKGDPSIVVVSNHGQLDELQLELNKTQLKMKDVIKENEKLKPEITNLNQMILDLQNKIRDCHLNLQALKEENEILKVNDEKSKIASALQSKEQEINVLQFDLSNLKLESNKLKTENGELKQSVVKLEQELQDSKFCQSALSEEISCQKTKNKQLQDSFDIEEFNNVNRQLSVSQQTMTALEIELRSKMKEIEKLRNLLQQSSDKSDEIFALTEQLALYKNDFEAERQSKVEMKRDKDQVCEDLRNIQLRNKQLQNEIEVLRARYEPSPEGYKCPKCSFGFTNYQALDNHIDRCLELDSLP